jgi:hypothetical protein
VRRGRGRQLLRLLQRRYPQVYDESLIPDRNGNHLIDYDELTGAAEEVA